MSVWCLVIDQELEAMSSVFSLHYAGNPNVDQLTRKAAKEGGLMNVMPGSLDAYYSSEINARMPPTVLGAALLNLKEKLDELYLPPGMLVSEANFGSGIMFVQLIEATEPLRKRRREPSIVDHFALLQESVAATQAPSLFASASDIKKLAASKRLSDRPSSGANVAPISLVYRPFGEFEDVLRGCLPVVEDGPIDLDANVQALITEMQNESARRDRWLELVNKTLHFDLHARPIGDVSTCHVQGVITTIVQFSDEVAPVISPPPFRCLLYLVDGHASSNHVKNLCGRYRIPTLGIHIIGDRIQFYAIALLGHKYRLVSLTSPLSFTLAATNTIHRQELSQAFLAAHVLQRRIHRDIDRVITSFQHLPLFRGTEYCNPAVNQLRVFRSSDQHINFSILGPHFRTGDSLFGSRFLYAAKLAEPDPTSPGHPNKRIHRPEDSDREADLIVKFSKSYSIELHQFCAAKGHAPRIYGYEVLPGGWHAIAMEYLKDARNLTRPLLPAQEDQLRDLVKAFHEQGLVHGDLRAANILCDNTGGRFWLIDFDWGGEADKVVYPTGLLNKELLAGRQNADLIIRREDDERILSAALEKVLS